MIRTPCRRGWISVARGSLLFTVALSSSLFAQPVPSPAPDAPANATAKESSQNVTVNDSPEARKDIETARSMEQQKEWVKAAGWYQQVLEKYRTRVVPWKTNSDNVIDRYRGIVYQVQQSLAKWPEDGIEAYRRQYESVAAGLLAKAAPGDTGALSSVLETYFVTESAKTAGIRLIDQHLEAGDFDAAAQVGDLLLNWYPASHLLVERPRILFRTALAHHLCHDDTVASELAAELQKSFPDAMGKIFGKDLKLNASLAELLKTSPNLGQAGAPDSWVMFGGSPDRAHISSSLGHIGARIFSIDLLNRSSQTPHTPDRTPDPNADEKQADEERGLLLGIMPVVDNGELFFQDGHRIWARELDSGIPLPGWAETYNSDDDLKGVYQLKGASVGHRGQFTLALTDSSVLAILGEPVMNNIPGVGGIEGFNRGNASGTRLVCLDRKTGQERWTVSLGSLEGDAVKPEDKERLRSLDMSGSPLVVGNNVYVLARGGKDAQFENCYVICFDSGTGHYRWSCLVASAGVPNNPYINNGEGDVGNSTISHLAYAGGRLYALTNLGALACLDAHDGSVVWLSIYRREGGDLNDGNGFRFVRGRAWGPNPTNQKPWEYNAVIAHDGKLFVLPVDSKFLFIYDAATGQELKAIDVSQFQDMQQPDSTGFDRPHTLVGLVGDRIIMTAEQMVYSLKWDSYDAQRQMSENVPKSLVYVRLRMDDGNQKIRGRAVLAAGSVVVATSRKLYRLDIAHDLQVAEVYPTGGQQEWDESEGPGNIVATADHVIIAGSNSVNVYTDMALARAKLDKEVAAAPQEPQPRLHYGEVMFAAGQSQLALDKLTEAVGLLGGSGQMRSGPDRQRIFNDALNFSKRLASDRRGESNEEALKFFNLAADAADTPIEQISYRLRRARFARDNVDGSSYATAVRLYQDILDHPDWRHQGVRREDDSSNAAATTGMDMQAGDLAEREIRDILQRHPEAYAAEEKLAVEALSKAQGPNDPDQLLAVADKYPNAAVASKAMLQASDAYEKAGHARQATHLLRQIYRKYGNTADKGLILEAMVRNYLTLPGGISLAEARLERAKNFADTPLSGPLKLPDGSVIEKVTFKEALAEMRKTSQGQPAPMQIDLHVPPMVQNADKTWPRPFLPEDRRAVEIRGITSLVVPPESVDGEWARPDRVVAIQNFEHLAIFELGNSKPLGTTDSLQAAPHNAIWLPAIVNPATQPTTGPAERQRLLVWSGGEVALLDGTSARPIWKSPINSLPACELANAAGLQGVQVSTDTLPGGAIRQESVAFVIDGRTGRRILFRNGQPIVIPVQQQAEGARQTGPEQICQLQPLTECVIAGTTTGRIACVALADGKLIWQARVSSRPIERMVVSEEFTAITVNDDGTVRLMVLDNFNGQVQNIRNFATDQGLVPQNLALSADGMLVWTLPDRLCAQDLYEPGNQLQFQYPSAPPPDADQAKIRGPVGMPISPGTAAVFAGCTRPGQLVISNNRILAVEQSGRFLVAHSLEDGSVLSHHDEHGVAIPTELSTNIPGNIAQQRDTNEVNMTLRTAGKYVYLLSPRSLIAYNLEDPAVDQWRADQTLSSNPNYKTAWAVRDQLLVEANPPGDAAANADVGSMPCELRIFDRRQIPDPGTNHTTEGGKIEYIYDIHDPSGVSQIQPVTGGVYWLAGDHMLHFLPGSRAD